MNKVSPKKLFHSKWTARKPVNKEKHFLVTEVEYDEDGELCHCLIEAVLSRRAEPIQWQELKNSDRWLQGWK